MSTNASDGLPNPYIGTSSTRVEKDVHQLLYQQPPSGQPTDVFKEALRQCWLTADQPPLAELALRTGLPEAEVHNVLRSKQTAPWTPTEQVLRSMGIRDDSQLQYLKDLHAPAYQLERRYLKGFNTTVEIHPDDNFALRYAQGRRELRDSGNQIYVLPHVDHRQFLLPAVQHRWLQVVLGDLGAADLGDVGTEPDFLEELRKLKAAAGGISLRDLEQRMRRKSLQHAFGKTTIGKYLGVGTTTLPNHPVEQVRLLITVLLEAANAGKEVTAEHIEAYVRTWQRLMKARVTGATTEPAEVPVEPEPCEVEQVIEPPPSLVVDHEEHQRRLAPPARPLSPLLLYGLPALAIAAVVVVILLQMKS